METRLNERNGWKDRTETDYGQERQKKSNFSESGILKRPVSQKHTSD